MKIWEKFTNWIASFRAVNGLDLPDAGRSSDESLGSRISGALSGYSTVSPVIDFECLKLLKEFWIHNPDFSQYVANIQNLANTGHNIQVDARSESQAEAALNRLNESASRIYKNGAGVDGLLNSYLSQIAWSGALSSEDVVNFAGRRVEQVVIVPVEQIRFKYDAELQQYVPYQRPASYISTARDNFGLIRLHPETYRYYALQTVENSPYAKPPASAVIETILNTQKPMMENIQYIIRKFGLLGFLTLSVTPPPKRPNETDAEHRTRCETYINSVAKTAESLLGKGMMVAFRDQKIEHTKVSDSATGVYDINRMSEEQVMSGFNMQPAFFGRTDSTTETYADVVYSLLLAQVHNFQRLVKRRQEATYRLDLRLGGLDVEGVSIKFNKTYSRNLLNENMAEEIKIRNVMEKVKSGLITPDEGAQELGYESWADEEMLNTDISLAKALSAVRAGSSGTLKTFAFRFDRNAQRYQPELQKLSIGLLPSQVEAEKFTAHENVVPIKKKAQQA